MTPSSPFEVMPLGTGNYFAAERFNTSLVLFAGGAPILVDLPEPLLRMCASASGKSGRTIRADDFDHVILTHLHGDHSNGLEGFGFYRKFMAGRKSKPVLHTSHEAAEKIWNKLAPSMAETYYPEDDTTESFQLSDFYSVKPFEIGGSLEVAGVRIETRRTRHSLPCFGFRAEFQGRKFGYSCDTCYDPHLIAFLEPCDLIFHECGAGPLHTPLAALEVLPPSIRKKMRLVHLDDSHPANAKIEAAEEGRVYSV